jgi:hypothetical protein
MSLVEEEEEVEAEVEEEEGEGIRTQISLWATTTQEMTPPIRRQAQDNQRTIQTTTRALCAEVPQTYSMGRGTKWTRSCKPSGYIEQSIADILR